MRSPPLPRLTLLRAACPLTCAPCNTLAPSPYATLIANRPLVREAVAIAQALLAADGTDRHGVRNFLLDLLLETGEWEQAVRLIEAYPGEMTEEWLWNRVLIVVKARGRDSKSATAALQRAMALNKEVYPLLVGDRLTESDEYAKASQQGNMYGTLPDGTVVGAPHNAVVYAQTYGKYWTAGTGGAEQPNSILSWLREAVEGGGEKMKATGVTREEIAKHDGSNAQGENASKKGKRAGLGALVCCASCGKYAGEEAGLELKMCSVCRAVGYCSRACQKKDWKAHKKICGKKQSADCDVPIGPPPPIAVGAIVVISGIVSQRELNGSRGSVTGGPDPETGRWAVRCAVDDKSRKLKPANLEVLQGDGATGAGGHPSWARLPATTRAELLRFHHEDGARIQGGGRTWEPWPVTSEAPAMLCYPMYSFLSMHPAQQYMALALPLPVHRMGYSDGASTVEGQMFPPNQVRACVRLCSS